MATHEFGWTRAGVIGHLIDASAVIAAQIGQTVVPIDLASFAQEAVEALALEGVRLVETRAVIQAGAIGALVDIEIAMTARPAGFANAPVITDEVGAR